MDLIIEKFSKHGMPEHCGLCKKFALCTRGNPEEICFWLKKKRTILKNIFLTLWVWIFFLSFNTTVFAALPTLGTISPASGTSVPDAARLFTCSYSDADGWANLSEAKFLISTASSTLINAVYLYYDQNTNRLYLRNDANTSWSGGYAPGSSYVIENSQVKVNCASTTVSGSGTSLTVTWNLSFKAKFSGKTYNSYLYVKDDAGGIVSWIKKGTYTVNCTPQVGVVTPSAPIGQIDTPFTFNTTYSDSDGWQNIRYAYVLVNTSTSGANCFYVYYDRSTNKLFLRNNNNSAWLGGYVPGSNYTIENSYVKLNCASTKISGSGTGLIITWSVIFKSSFMGSKNIYLYVKDNVGSYERWIQKDTCWIVEPGMIIGSQGGEVISSDGKVKLVIPEGVLTSPHGIEILQVNKDTLQNATPTGATLLSVVECKPYGLVFNKPVSLTYTLYQAEVPGTAVELGLYDSVQAKIIPTGQTSVISADGYSVTFALTHFSTYAALKSLTPQGVPIGGGVKIPLPDMLTGAYSHSIPIAIPPGRKGLQPAIALTYRSSNANSWVGLGFSLNPGYIVRSTRLGPPTYIDTQDTFYLITDAGTTELVHLIDNVYQAKIESTFTKFFKEQDDSWKVVAKDGSILRFGQSADSKETSTQGTFSWYLTKAIDTNGNYIECSYTKDQGKSYLSRIDYTGNETVGISPRNSIEFFLESKDDISSSYISGVKIITAKRLKEIQVKVNSALVWRYVLEYGYSQDTNRSLLSSVTQYAGDGKSLPIQRFTYQKSK